MLHESSQGEPQAVGNRKVIADAGLVIHVPFVRTEATDQEQHNTDADVGEYNTHPDLVRQRIHEREDIRLLVRGPLHHDADAKAHERLREVDVSLTNSCYCQRCNHNVGFLKREVTVYMWINGIYTD